MRGTGNGHGGCCRNGTGTIQTWDQEIWLKEWDLDNMAGRVKGRWLEIQGNNKCEGGRHVDEGDIGRKGKWKGGKKY